MKLFEEAASLGDINAKNQLNAVYYEIGHKYENEADLDQAIIYYKKSVAEGRKEAEVNLAQAYIKKASKFETTGDLDTAVECYQKAADLGNKSALVSLYEVYMKQAQKYESLGDLKEAKVLYEKTAEYGNTVAMVKIANFYEEGKGTEQDFAKAVVWYQNALDGGNKDAFDKLANLYVTIGDNSAKDNNLDKSIQYYLRAHEMFNLNATFKLGTIYETFGNKAVEEAQISTAITWYTKAGEFCNAQAMERLGDFYSKHENGRFDYHLALAWYRKAVKYGNTKALAAAETLKSHTNIAIKLREFIIQNKERLRGSNYFVTPDVPEKLINEAVDSYAPNFNVQQIAVLFDIQEGKIFGFSFGKKKPKKGFIITNNGYVVAASGNKFSLTEVKGFGLKGKSIVALPNNILVTELKDEPSEADQYFVNEVNNILYNINEQRYDYFLPLFYAINEFRKEFGAKNCFYPVPEIPLKKLTNVFKSYACWTDLKPEDVLLLIDTTISGNAKDGCIFTDKSLITSSGLDFDIKNIRQFEYKDNKGIFIKNTKVVSSGNYEREVKLVELLNKAISGKYNNSQTAKTDYGHLQKISNDTSLKCERNVAESKNNILNKKLFSKSQNKCSNCGYAIRDGAKFCGHCGAKISNDS